MIKKKYSSCCTLFISGKPLSNYLVTFQLLPYLVLHLASQVMLLLSTAEEIEFRTCMSDYTTSWLPVAT